MYKIKIAVVVVVIAVAGWLVWNNHHKHLLAKSAQKAVAAQKAAVAAQAKQASAKELASHCAGNTSGHAVIVSVARQHMWACAGSQTIYNSAVTTGASAYGDGTPTGTWAIQDKQTNRYLKGSDDRGSWNDFVKYWVPYDGAYGFHDSSWQTFAYGDLTKYQTDGSHGCVHLPLAAMKWLYDWAPVGTTVTIQN